MKRLQHLLGLTLYTVLLFSNGFFLEANATPSDKSAPQSLSDFHDRTIVQFATDIVTLITIYKNPEEAEKNFRETYSKLDPQAAALFKNTMQRQELNLIFDTNRSQIFRIKHDEVLLDRDPSNETAVVRISGTREKSIGDHTFEPEQMVFFVKVSFANQLSGDVKLVVTDIRASPAADLELADAQKKLPPEVASAISLLAKKLGTPDPLVHARLEMLSKYLDDTNERINRMQSSESQTSDKVRDLLTTMVDRIVQEGSRSDKGFDSIRASLDRLCKENEALKARVFELENKK